MMNKYMGFFELKDMDIPSVPWNIFDDCTKLDEGMLWTIRVAVERGADMNLPRLVGVTAREAYEKGRELLARYKNHGMVVYYPYFIAAKSGVMEVSSQQTVIEAVNEDLWNLVTYGKKDVTVVVINGKYEFYGEKDFLTDGELEKLLHYERIMRQRYRDCIIEGQSILSEWSFAFNTDIRRKPIGDPYLIFYELRSV